MQSYIQENCKLKLNLNGSHRKLQRIVIQNRKDSAAKKRFADHGGEMFYVDYVEPGNPKKRRSYCGLRNK